MKKLLSYHYSFFKSPRKMVLQEYNDISIKVGLGAFLLYMGYDFFSNPEISRITYDYLSTTFNVYSFGIFYVYIFLSMGLGLLSHYYIVPFILSLLSADRKAFDMNKYRKIIFVSVLPYVIFCCIVLLPLKLAASLLLTFEFAIIGLVITTIANLLAIWLLVLFVIALIMRWEGIKTAYQLSNSMTFLVVFIFPLITSIPYFFIYGGTYIEYFKNYIGA